jgi:phage terminase large subunit
MAANVVTVDGSIPAKCLPVWTAPRRYNVLHGGRGGGKSVTVARILVLLAATSTHRVMCARETQASIAESVHRLLADEIGRLKLAPSFDVTKTAIKHKTTGSEFAFVGLREHGVTSIKSYEGFDLCWVEEAHSVSKRSLDILIPTLRKPGSRFYFTFNPELDTDEAWVRFVEHGKNDSGVLTIEINWRDNPWFPAELNAERIRWKARDPDTYDWVWEGKLRAAVDGAIYAKEVEAIIRDGRVGRAPYDPLLKVHTVWDLGWNDATAIALVQRIPSGELRVIDYIEDSHRTIADYVAELDAKRLNWGTDFLPHDARAKSQQTGISTEEMVQRLGRERVHVLGADDIEEGIRLARMMLPRVWMDEKARGLLQAVRRYRRRRNQATGTFGEPVHDDASHGSDVLRYMAAAEHLMTNANAGTRRRPAAAGSPMAV